MTPGSDILSDALMCIDASEIQVCRFNARTKNPVGQWVTSRAEPSLPFEASVQPVKRSKYVALGLDFKKVYIRVYVSLDVHDFTDYTAGDVILYNGDEYAINDNSDWYVIDGWVSLTCVKILPKGATTP
jgi:hypothetical protein